ncbi:hypothetical protein M404DRAFT_994549 [Pisolithus tinctorius Marx 270]|uniref:Uncharacterized protein n=1 Tax=Pisolithus tinctorius Marx 270 TaxID=870435 RepID=A0A0C3PDM5_PISTI|nr:hypothetical protein M404DRAFT_994549 [Pisolithus tinctorius Marx 270]
MSIQNLASGSPSWHIPSTKAGEAANLSVGLSDLSPGIFLTIYLPSGLRLSEIRLPEDQGRSNLVFHIIQH